MDTQQKLTDIEDTAPDRPKPVTEEFKEQNESKSDVYVLNRCDPGHTVTWDKKNGMSESGVIVESDTIADKHNRALFTAVRIDGEVTRMFKHPKNESQLVYMDPGEKTFVEIENLKITGIESEAEST